MANRKTPKSKQIAYLETLSDEKLLSYIRKKNQKARDVLSIRYYKLKEALLSLKVKEYRNILDKWEENEVYFRSYLSAEQNYNFKSALFRTYFASVLKTNYIHDAMEKYETMTHETPVASYQNETTTEETEYSLLDIAIPGQTEAEAIDSRLDILEFARSLPEERKIGMLIIMKAADGYTLKEACDALSISVNEGKYELQMIREAFANHAHRRGILEGEKARKAYLRSYNRKNKKKK